MRRRYPFDGLLALRRRKSRDDARALADEIEKSDRSRRALAQAEAAERAVGDEIRGVEAENAARLVEGLERAADLARAGEWRAGAERRADAARSRRADAEESQQQQLRVETAARATLGEAKADERVIERHRERWSAAERARDEVASEDDAADVIAARSKHGRSAP